MASSAYLPVAQYLRMSTEHQQYSTAHQSVAILQYAESHNMEIVRTYADHGKSGLGISTRLGLKQLLREALAPDVDFRAVLVYDVSRWGRSRIRIRQLLTSTCFRLQTSLSTTARSHSRTMAVWHLPS